MGKENKNLVNLSISEDFIERLFGLMENLADRTDKLEKQKIIQEAEDREYYKSEKEMVKKEFDRICEIMSKTDPLTNEYRKLADSLNDVKRVIGYNLW